MDILVDDRPYESTPAPEQTVGQLANELCGNATGPARRLVTELKCDGESLSGDVLNAALNRPINSFSRLEFQTQPVGNMVRATMDQAISLFENATAHREQAADLLSEGQHQEAMKALQQYLQVWQQVQQTVVVSLQAMETDFESLTANGQSAGEVLELIRTQLEELKDSMQQGDFVLVADVLRYELAEPFDLWLQLMKQIRDISANQ